MLPLNLVSNFVDVVSYIRLFAVGTAGYAVAVLVQHDVLAAGCRASSPGWSPRCSCSSGTR